MQDTKYLQTRIQIFLLNKEAYNSQKRIQKLPKNNYSLKARYLVILKFTKIWKYINQEYTKILVEGAILGGPAVTIIGFGEENGGSYCIAANSWELTGVKEDISYSKWVILIVIFVSSEILEKNKQIIRIHFIFLVNFEDTLVYTLSSSNFI